MKKRDFIFYLFVVVLFTFGVTLHLTTSNILKISEKNIGNLRHYYHQEFFILAKDIPSDMVLTDLTNLEKTINLSQGTYQWYEIMLVSIITSVTLLIAYPISKYRHKRKQNSSCSNKNSVKK